jgi:hypothetical protein
MKKVTLTDLSGKEIEVYFADDKTAQSAVHSDKYDVKIENVPSDKDWFEMTGGDAGELNEMDVNENSAGEGAHQNLDDGKGQLWSSLTKSLMNKIKSLEGAKDQIKIDDSIPSDFVELSELRNGAIYKVAGLNLMAKLVNKQLDDYAALLKMSRHGTIFYVGEGSLMKATDFEVELYLEGIK